MTVRLSHHRTTEPPWLLFIQSSLFDISYFKISLNESSSLYFSHSFHHEDFLSLDYIIAWYIHLFLLHVPKKIPFDLTILSLIRDHPCSPKNCFCCCPSFPSQQPSSHSYLNSLQLPKDPIGKLTSPIYKTLNSHTFPQNFAKITIITCSTTFPYKSFPPLS